MIKRFSYYKTLLIGKKRKGGYLAEAAGYTIVVLGIIAVICTVSGLTPTDLATLILNGIKTVITKITSKF